MEPTKHHHLQKAQKRFWGHSSPQLCLCQIQPMKITNMISNKGAGQHGLKMKKKKKSSREAEITTSSAQLGVFEPLISSSVVVMELFRHGSRLSAPPSAVRSYGSSVLIGSFMHKTSFGWIIKRLCRLLQVRVLVCQKARTLHISA